MNSEPLIHVHASKPIIQSWTEREVEHLGFVTSLEPQPTGVHLIADHPATWALHRLEALPITERSRTVITMMTSHPVYLDCLASYKLSGVCVSMGGREMLASLYAASIRGQTYQAKSDLTKAELRVVRSLLKGMDADALACGSVLNATSRAPLQYLKTERSRFRLERPLYALDWDV